MSNDIKTIHEFDFNLICEYFSNVERQGPGSPEITLKALSFIDNLTPHSLIADIGCGTGGQTITLAQTTPIIGVTKTTQIQAAVQAAAITLAKVDVITLEAAAEIIGVDTRGSWEMPMI